MPTEHITIDMLRELINKGESKDPLIFLEAIMNGQDPRRLSDIYKLVCEIDSFTNGDLSREDWAEIVDAVTATNKYHVVTVKESMDAAKTLSEYVHSKKKSIEISGLDDDVSAHATPLTEGEIELFREKFNDEF